VIDARVADPAGIHARPPWATITVCSFAV